MGIHVLLALVSACCGTAEEKLEEAYRLLRDTSRIETSKIYESGKPSQLVTAYQRIALSKEARQLFISLFRESKTDAGRVYALIWLWKHDRNSYVSLLKHMKSEMGIDSMWYDLKLKYKWPELQKMLENYQLEKELLGFKQP